MRSLSIGNGTQNNKYVGQGAPLPSGSGVRGLGSTFFLFSRLGWHDSRCSSAPLRKWDHARAHSPFETGSFSGLLLRLQSIKFPDAVCAARARQRQCPFCDASSLKSPRRRRGRRREGGRDRCQSSAHRSCPANLQSFAIEMCGAGGKPKAISEQKMKQNSHLLKVPCGFYLGDRLQGYPTSIHVLIAR